MQKLLSIRNGSINLSNKVAILRGMNIIVCITVCRGQVVMASGWESECRGFKPHHLQATFEPSLPKQKYPASVYSY